ncbi:hypothetical protein ACF0H5_005990 [Mactra antiquata]
MGEESSHILALKKQLQLSLVSIKQCNEIIKEVRNVTIPCIQSVQNLTDQYQCCTAAKLSSTTSFNFLEVKENLLFKIAAEISNEIIKMRNPVGKLKDCSEKIERQYEKCMLECEQCKSSVDIDCLVKKTPLYPSLSEILMWIDSIQRGINESYLCKKYILDTYTPDNLQLCDTLETNWTDGDKDLLLKIDECLAFTSHFQELKLT